MPFWHSACDRSTRTAAGDHGFRPALERILTLDFLDRSENLILVGAHGLGKTMLAKNIAHQAVLAGHTALFTTAADLLLDLNGQETARALERRLRHYTRPALLVVDELGYLSYDVRAADLIFQLVSRRYEHRSMLITTNLPFKRWADANDAAARSVSDCRVSPGRSRSGSENAHLSRLRVVASASSSSAISCVRLTLFVQFVRIRNRIMSETILGALRDRLLQPEPVCQVLDRVHEEVKTLCAHVPDMLKAKTAQLAAARLRVDRIVNFVSLGRAQDSKALAEALAENEALVVSLEAEVENLRQASDSRVRFPSRAWIEKRLAALRELLERRTEASGLLLRRLLGRMVLEPVYPDQGVPYYVAKTSLDVLVLLEHPGPGPDPGSDPGANSFGWWTRNERTRTVAALPLEEVLCDTVPAPLHRRLAGAAAAFCAKAWAR